MSEEVVNKEEDVLIELPEYGFEIPKLLLLEGSDHVEE